ncbi:MAG: S4 domain-containing protein [Gammaproteobacteria bacterium]|nr:S4 domain-containing protein [Gammaproteobacteria bacterium]
MSELEKLRIDKWLWAARFFKTRSLASDAVNGGKVHLNNERVKAAKAIKVGDSLRIRRGDEVWQVCVLSLFEKRRQASLAQTMYEELEDSLKLRENLAADRKALSASRVVSHRPSKKERRHIIKFKNIHRGD